MRDLTDAPDEEVAAERARVATEGTGAQLLALQAPDGRWGGAAWNRGWDSTMHVLSLLREMGLDPESSEARRVVGLVRDRVTWQGCGPQEADDNPFFAGEVEPCINGQVAASGAYFGQDVQGIIDQLLGEQLADGGWNCEAPNGSMRSSFNTTICVLEAPARTRTGRWGQPGAARGPSPRAGVPPRTPPLPPTVDRRGDRARSQKRRRVDAFRLPDLVALRRAARARIPATRRRRAR